MLSCRMTCRPHVWDELCLITDLCLRLHRCAIQASRRAMALMVVQERARWPNLSSLSHKEKAHLLDVPVDPKGLFGPAVPTMQKRCEEKKREGEELQLCLPRKVPPPPPTTPRQTFAQVAARPHPQTSVTATAWMDGAKANHQNLKVCGQRSLSLPVWHNGRMMPPATLGAT